MDGGTVLHVHDQGSRRRGRRPGAVRCRYELAPIEHADVLSLLTAVNTSTGLDARSGFTDTASEATEMWVDCLSSAYDKRFSNAPDNYGGAQHCARTMTPRLRDDVSCPQDTDFVCHDW